MFFSKLFLSKALQQVVVNGLKTESDLMIMAGVKKSPYQVKSYVSYLELSMFSTVRII